jgi:hypothetical protein
MDASVSEPVARINDEGAAWKAKMWWWWGIKAMNTVRSRAKKNRLILMKMAMIATAQRMKALSQNLHLWALRQEVRAFAIEHYWRSSAADECESSSAM